MARLLDKNIYHLYPHGALDIIQYPNEQGCAKIKTLYLDGAHEEGELKNGVKNGVFRFFDKNKKLIASATFQNNRAMDGQVALPAAKGFILYTYSNGNLTALEELSEKGFKKIICRIENGKPTSGLVPVVDAKDNKIKHSYQAYQDGKLVAALVFDDFEKLKEKQKIDNQTIQIERFYNNGKIKYAAQSNVSPLKAPLSRAIHINAPNKPLHTDENSLAQKAKNSAVADFRPSQSPISVLDTSGKNNTLPNPMVTPEIKAYSPTDDKLIAANFSQKPSETTHSLPLVSQEILFAPDGNAVLLSQNTNNEKKSLRVKIKDFFALLTQTPLPKTDKQLLMSGILKLKQKTAVAKQPLPHSPRIASATQRKSAQKISLLKNKFRFFLTRQHGIDKR